MRPVRRPHVLWGGRRAGRAFLASELAVRLTPDGEAGRRRPAEWSTAAHRALEDRTVALVDTLAGRSGRAVDPQVVKATLAAAGGLGDDQGDAVRVLSGPVAVCAPCWPRPGTGRRPCCASPLSPPPARVGPWWRWPPRPRRWPNCRRRPGRPHHRPAAHRPRRWTAGRRQRGGVG